MRTRRIPGLLLLLGLLPGTPAESQKLPPYKPGFPVTFAGAGTTRAHPAVADLGLTPGHKSIVFGTVNGRLYVVKWDGTVATGFPQTISPVSPIDSGPSVGDLDGDGAPDIVVGYGAVIDPTKPGGVVAYRRDGTLLWQRASRDFGGNPDGSPDGVPDPVLGTPVIADIDGDGAAEVVWGSLDARVYAVRGIDGADKPGWPIFVRDTVFTSPALFDMDGDLSLEVIIGVDAHTEPAVGTVAGGYVHVFYATGQPNLTPYASDPPGTRTLPAPELPGFPQHVDQTLKSAPSVGDIDGDGEPEIVVGTGSYYTTGSRRAYAFNCDGTAPAGWPVNVDGWVSSSPALADVNGDGALDVIITDGDERDFSFVASAYAFNGATGARIWKVTPKSYSGWTPWFGSGDPLVADVLGTSALEVLTAVNTDVCVLDAATGTQLTESAANPTGKVSFYTPTALSNAIVTDFETDGVAIEVVAVSGSPHPDAPDAQVRVFNPVKTAPPAEGPWGAFRQSERRRGFAPGTPPCAQPEPPPPLRYYSLSPCRVLDTRDAVGPFGGPALAALSQRSFNVLGRCSIPADAKALTVNLTSVEPTDFGSLRIFGGTGTPPGAMSLLMRPGKTRAGQVMVEVIGGAFTIANTQQSGSTHVLVDVSGVFR